MLAQKAGSRKLESDIAQTTQPADTDLMEPSGTYGDKHISTAGLERRHTDVHGLPASGGMCSALYSARHTQKQPAQSLFWNDIL